MKTLAWIASVIVTVLTVILLVAQALVSTDKPIDAIKLRGDQRFDFKLLNPSESVFFPRIENYSARDNTLLGYRHYKSKSHSNIRVYFLHSAGWQGMEFNMLASRLAYTFGVSDVYVPDLRGHGGSPVRRGEIEYEGQLEDDLADLIKRTSKPGDIIIVGGHSEGGGLAVRFASSAYGSIVKGYILLAPVLSLEFPTSRTDLGGWIKPLTQRIFGLEVLNAVGLHWLDDSIAAQYAIPSSLRDGDLGYTVTTNYSWRLLKSMQTRNNDGSDLATIKVPLLVISGANDTVIFPEKSKPAIERFIKSGEYQIIDGENHLSIVNSPKTLAIIQNWMAKLR